MVDLCQFVRSAFGYSLFAMGLQRYQVLSASTALVLHLALGLLLVPVYGIRGGAAASLAAESASAVVAAFYYWKHRSSEWLPVQNKGLVQMLNRLNSIHHLYHYSIVLMSAVIAGL